MKLIHLSFAEPLNVMILNIVVATQLLLPANAISFPTKERTIFDDLPEDVKGHEIVIDIDDKVEVGMLLGGWGNDRPILIRSDGVVCSDGKNDIDINTMPTFPQGPFVDAAAVHIYGLGVILCGGMVGTPDNHTLTNKCYLMDFHRRHLTKLERTFIEMSNTSNVPFDVSDRKYAKMSMAMVDGDSGDLEMLKLFLYVNGTNSIFKGQLLFDETCDPYNTNATLCSRYSIVWTEIKFERKLRYREAVLDSQPCLVSGFGRNVLLIGGLDEKGHPVRTSFAVGHNGVLSLAVNTFLPGASRAFHACLQVNSISFSPLHRAKPIVTKRLYVAGGIVQPFLNGSRITRTSSSILSNDGQRRFGWKNHPKMITSRSGFQLLSLKTGHKSDTNILAVGGIKLRRDNTFETLDLVDQFDGTDWYRINPETGGIPKMARFVAVAVPFNITVHCNCVPDKVTTQCAYLLIPPHF